MCFPLQKLQPCPTFVFPMNSIGDVPCRCFCLYFNRYFIQCMTGLLPSYPFDKQTCFHLISFFFVYKLHNKQSFRFSLFIIHVLQMNCLACPLNIGSHSFDLSHKRPLLSTKIACFSCKGFKNSIHYV